MPDHIYSLTLESTYLIVDPSQTKYSCNPPSNFLPKVIIVASPDGRHWGGSEFVKRRGYVAGRFMYYPMWTLDELLVASETLPNGMSSEGVIDAYRYYGGVPRHVFDKSSINWVTKVQDSCVWEMSMTDARNLVSGVIDEVGSFQNGIDKSFVMGINLLSDEHKRDIPFSNRKVTIISDRVFEQFATKFVGALWNEILRWDNEMGDKIFEAYTRVLMIGKEPIQHCSRSICTASKQLSTRKLGGCTQIKLVQNPIQEVVDTKKDPNVLFYSSNHQLCDFIYRDNNGYYNVFFATTRSAGQKGNAPDILELEELLGNSSKLRLHFLVPEEIFESFTFNVNNLISECSAYSCQIFCVKIQRPNQR